MAEGPIDFPEEPDYLFAAKSAATLAISLLDRAFSQMDGGNKKEGYKEKLLQKLRSIQADLDEAVRRQIVEENAGGWVPDFMYVVEETEGAIDEIDYRRLEEEVRNPISKSAKAKIVNKVARFVIPNRNLRRLRKAVHRLDEFASELSGYCQHLVAHDAPDDDVISPAPQLEHYPSWIATEGVFLRVKEKEQIVKWLIKNPAEGPEIVSADHISIFAILGIAGMGKTTLAKLVRQDPRVSTNFDFVAFVPVSDDFTAEAITAVILQSIADISPAYYSIKFLQHTLTDKKLLLILDDVWEDNSVHKWEALMALLRGCKRGSRILLTTRMQSVADMAAAATGAAAEYLKLDDLDEDDNFMLFKSRLPSHSHIDSEGYADLLWIGEQITKKIGGCPLVTIIVASWLGSHLEAHHWEAVLQNGWQHIEPIMKNIIAVSLRLSYDHLPTQLQICFRYCSIFPKGYKFNKVELANMWICSGLITFTSSKPEDIDLQKAKDADSSSPEDVGEQYFDALARKSFFCCMLETEPSNGDQKEYYVLPSLMHDLAQLVSQGECARVDYGCDFRGVMKTTEHLYLAHCPRSILQNMYGFRFLRTLIIQSEFCLDQQTENVLAEVLRQLKRLRLLYLAVPSLFDALDSVSSLINLRYLFLFSCDESHLHKVFKLYHLQVFKLNYFTVKEGDLDDIHNLRYLRCLHVPENMSSKIHQIGRLTSLQELHGFEVVENGDHRLIALRNLRSLRQLSLRNLQNFRDYNEAMEVKLKEKHDMRFLSLSWNKHMNDPESLDNRTIDNLEPNKELQWLRIHGYHGVILPFWIANSVLINLVSLELEYCMKWKRLPSLQEINSLKYLKLEHLFQLEYIGAVLDEQFAANKSENACLPPFLNTLIVRWCPSLKKLPAIPCTLEQLIIKHVGLAVLPRICQRYTGRCESSSSSAAAKSYLAFLHIESCAHLTSLDEGFLEQQEHLQALTTLAVRHCERLRYLPTKGFTELHHLNFLDIVACPMLRDARTEGSLLPISVKSLDINPCGDIEDSILNSLQNLTSLKRLTLFNCSNIEELPSVEVFGTLNNLNDMSVVRCKNVLSLGGLGAVASLKVLSILCCEKLNFSYSPQAGCSFKLHKLKIDRQALLLVEPLRSLRHINELHICDDYAMESLPEEWLLQNGTSLRSIEIGVAESLRSLPSQLAKLESLQCLHIERAPLIQSLPQLPASLSKLTIWGCDPMLLKRYEKDSGLDWGRIACIADVDMKAYSEGMNYSDDWIQDFDNSTSNPCRQFVVID